MDGLKKHAARCGTALSIFIALFLMMSGDVSARKTVQKTKPVTVSIPPQKYLVERVGGKYIEVDVMLPPGQSPATYAPTPQQVMRLRRSEAYFMISVPFETKFMQVMGAHARKLNLKHMFDGIDRLPVDSTTYDLSEGDHGHDHGAGLGFDPHIWLDPMMARQMARNTCDDLKQIYPRYDQEFEANYKTFASDLDSIHVELTTLLEPYKGRSFIAFHPSFGYFARAYGLKQIAIEHEGKEASAKRLTRIIDVAREHHVGAIIVQEQFSDKQAKQIATEIGCEVIKLDPLSEDYLNNLRVLASRIAESCSK